MYAFFVLRDRAGDGRATAATTVARTCERRSGRERVDGFHVAEILPSGGSHSASHGLAMTIDGTGDGTAGDGTGDGRADGVGVRERRIGVGGGAAGCVHSPWARPALRCSSAINSARIEHF